MRFGRLAGNDWINTRIYECFGAIDSRDVETFVRKFRTENDQQRFHTFRELICGAELFRRGLKPRYEQALGGLTPDWTIYGEGGIESEIVDVVTLHPRHDVEKDIARTVGSGQIWAGWITTAPGRLYGKLQDKFGAYSTFAEKARLAFIVAQRCIGTFQLGACRSSSLLPAPPQAYRKPPMGGVNSISIHLS